MKFALLLFLLAAANTEAAFFRGFARNNTHNTPIVVVQATSNSTLGTASDGSSLFPASPTSDFLQGYDMVKGEMPVGVFEAIVNCTCAKHPTDACYQEGPAPDGMHQYSTMVSTEAATSALTKTVVSVEGGGWGVHVSASTKYLQESTMNTRSVSFILGQSSKTLKRSVRNAGNLKLTAQAKQLLHKDPEQFLQNYGPHYTKAIEYGGSFFGSYTLNSEDSSSHSDLDVAAKVSYSGAFFSASGSADFQKDRSSTFKNLNIDANFRSSPVVNIKYDPLEGPNKMFEIFKDWEDELEKNPVPLTVALASWTDSTDVAAIINKLPKDVQQKFNKATLSTDFVHKIAEDVNKAQMLRKSIVEAEGWHDLAPPQKQQLQALDTKVDRHVEESATRLTEARLLQLQDDYIDRGDTSWFTANAFEDEFNAIVAQIPTPAPTPPGFRLYQGQRLVQGQRLSSQSKQITLEMQTDGNLVLYGVSRKVLWASNTAAQCSEQSLCHLDLQSDGNLVLYHDPGHVLWSANTKTTYKNNGQMHLDVQDDRNLVLYDLEQEQLPVWSSARGHEACLSVGCCVCEQPGGGAGHKKNGYSCTVPGRSGLYHTGYCSADQSCFLSGAFFTKGNWAAGCH
jgi:hypothetical protein